MKTWVMGDIHGANKALIQCLARSGFDNEEDTLIHLGDVVDGWSETYECVETLLGIKNLISIKGNHDDWFLDFIQHGIHLAGWRYGAHATARSYLRQIDKEHLIYPKGTGYVTTLNNEDIPPTHQKFFSLQHLYYIDSNNNCFVHGGFNRHIEFKGQGVNVYSWDRDLWGSAMSYKDTGYRFKMHNHFKEVFIGHTATTTWKNKYNTSTLPMNAANIWNLDTGAGFIGKLTIMNVDTKEYFQSDFVSTLYPEEQGRNKE